MSRVGRRLSCALLLAFLSSGAWAQGIFATLTGIVTDPSQSVVPNAKVTLHDVGSGSERQTTTTAMVILLLHPCRSVPTRSS